MLRQLSRLLGFSLVLTLGVFAVAGCDSGDTTGQPSRRSAAIPQGEVPSPRPLNPGEGAFERCQPGPRGGGYNVWIQAIPCNQARQWILRLLPTFNLAHRQGIGREESGWQCLTQSERPTGPYHYVCTRGPQLIVFAASF
jgi:hypothetical protein